MKYTKEQFNMCGPQAKARYVFETAQTASFTQIGKVYDLAYWEVYSLYETGTALFEKYGWAKAA